MIIGSILLVLAAAALFVAGLYRGSAPGPLYYSSIVTSVLAAFTLVVGLRQGNGRYPALDDDFDLGRDGAHPLGPGPATTLPVVPAPRTSEREALPDVPDDEPAEQVLGTAEAIAISHLRDVVLVVDGRPRYHLGDCLHLLGRQRESMPVNEAIAAAFTACADCQPVGRLLRRRPDL